MLTDLRARMTRQGGDEGFTLIELLIVVVIIGILAAIAIPQFSSTKEKAFDASAKSDLRNAMTSIESYFVENQDYAVTSSPTPSALPDFNSSTNVNVAVAGDADSYAIVAKHTASDNFFYVCGGDGENGQVQQSSSSPSSCSGGTTVPSTSGF